MKPNLETGNVEMSEDEFNELVGCVQWLKTGISVLSVEDLEVARNDFMLGTLIFGGEDKVSVGAVFDVLPTWTLGKAATSYSLDVLSQSSKVLSRSIRYNRYAHEQETGSRFYKFTDGGIGPISKCTDAYVTLLGCAMELEEHETKQ